MSDKNFAEHLVVFADKVGDILEHAIKLVDTHTNVPPKVTSTEPESTDETKSEKSFYPTKDYVPARGDTVKIRPGYKVRDGVVVRVFQDNQTAKVAIGTLDCVQGFTVTPWEQIELVEKARRSLHETEVEAIERKQSSVQQVLNDSLDEAVPETADSLQTYHEHRTEIAEENARRVSSQHSSFVRELQFYLGDSSLSEREVLNRVKSQLSTLAALKRRLRTADDLAAIRAVEDLMSNS